MTQQENKPLYDDIINNISIVLNQKKRNRHLKEMVLNNLVLLKQHYKTELSTYFLLKLINNKEVNKSQKIRDLIREFKTEHKNFYYTSFNSVLFKTNAFNFGLKKGFCLNTDSNKLKDNCLKGFFKINICKSFKEFKKRQFTFIKIE